MRINRMKLIIIAFSSHLHGAGIMKSKSILHSILLKIVCCNVINYKGRLRSKCDIIFLSIYLVATRNFKKYCNHIVVFQKHPNIRGKGLRSFNQRGISYSPHLNLNFSTIIPTCYAFICAPPKGPPQHILLFSDVAIKYVCERFWAFSQLVVGSWEKM